MNNLFKDKVVIVTGASSGTGEATAREFAQSGSKVVLAARSEENMHLLPMALSRANRLKMRRDLCLPNTLQNGYLKD